MNNSVSVSIGDSSGNNGLLKEAKYVEAERYGTIALLQDEIVRESPPLPDRDDSPPPIYRQPNSGNCTFLNLKIKLQIFFSAMERSNVERSH